MSMLPIAAMAVISGTAGTFNPIPESCIENPVHHLRVLYENDAISGDDQDYTHGTRLEYIHDGVRDCDAAGWGVSLTQNIYTPKTHAYGAVPGEHPYAGFLGMGAIGYLRDFETGFGFATEIQLGVIGEPSLAHGVQHFIHEVGQIEVWKGWHDQVPAEPAFQISHLEAYRVKSLSGYIGAWEAETFVYGRADVGNIMISGGLGMGFRIGRNLPQYGAQVSGNRAANIGIALATPRRKAEKFSYYLTGNVFGEYVARDFSIDGGVFHHFDRTCSRVPWQAEARLGVGATYKGVEYFMGVVGHSRTYRSQDDPSVYGTFSVSWHW